MQKQTEINIDWCTHSWALFCWLQTTTFFFLLFTFLFQYPHISSQCVESHPAKHKAEKQSAKDVTWKMHFSLVIYLHLIYYIYKSHTHKKRKIHIFTPLPGCLNHESWCSFSFPHSVILKFGDGSIPTIEKYCSTMKTRISWLFKQFIHF